MNEINFPFCLVTARQGDLSLPVTPKDGYVAAFSTVEKAASYMFQRGETRWRMTLVSRPTLKETVASLRLFGVRGIAYDPTEEHPGAIANFEDIEKSSE